MGKDNHACIGAEEFGERVREVINYRRLTNITNLPPLKTMAKVSSKAASKSAFYPASGIVFTEPASIEKATTEKSVPTGNGKATIQETEVPTSTFLN